MTCVKTVFLLFAIFISFTSEVFANPGLQKFLEVDRLHAYLQRWAQHMEGQGKGEFAKAVRGLVPAQLAQMDFKGANLSDAFEYDKIIHQILTRERRFAQLLPQDVAWNYNFYKRKLNEAYVVDEPVGGKAIKALVVEPDRKGVSITPAPSNASDVLLNVDGYVSGRTTRGVFWEASASGRPIELHVGTARDFRRDLAERGGKIVGQVKTLERNYNPIYLVELPGEKTHRYAITELSGADRVKHFTMQAQLMSWNGGKPPPLELVGDPALHLLREEKALTEVLSTLPHANKVIIGQKGAFERTLGGLAKANSILELAKARPAEVARGLSKEHLKALEKLKADPQLVFKGPNPLSAVEKLYDEVKPLFEKFNLPEAVAPAVFDLDRGSYEVSDYVLKDARGNPQRWRVFSNSWGDEVVPIGKALKATGHNDVIYIGTAGALPGNGIKVGDVVVPQEAMTQEGKMVPVRHKGAVPEWTKKVSAVVNVSSPFEETPRWLERVGKHSQVVEIETSYLAQIFNGKNDKFSPYLLVSDVVGVEGETLAEASSSARRSVQHAVLAGVLDEAGAKVPVPSDVNGGNKLAEWIDELAPNRDPTSRFQVIREAQARGVVSKGEFKEFLKSESSFTTGRLESALKESGRRFESLMDGRVPGKVSIGRSFLEGRYNPAKGPIKLHVQVHTAKAEAEFKLALAELRKTDKTFSGFLDVQVARGPPDQEFVKLHRLPESRVETFLDLYKDSALGFGGLAATETRSGALKFVQVGPGIKGKVEPSLAYFAPDEATEGFLKDLSNGSETPEEILKSGIKLVEGEKSGRPWKIRYTVVDGLVGGNLAQIVPEFIGKDSHLTIHLRITKEGLKNPAVVLEELIHLQQIAGSMVPWGTGPILKYFISPSHWAEVVANSQAGSMKAAEMLARLEVEAANASADALDYYVGQGLFSKDKTEVDRYLKSRRAHAEELYMDVARMAKVQDKKMTEAWKKTKKVFEQLEKKKVKLNDLVAKGDRKGVRKLVETYLPWDLMEPSEIHAWKGWLEAIERPDKGNMKLVFRGLDGDVVFRTADDAPYFMPTVLTKNQGNYTRRLRSLTTMRDKMGRDVTGFSYQADSSFGFRKARDPHALSVMMKQHSVDPLGSPFLSTSTYEVASGFASEKMAAFNIDKRRLVSNFEGFTPELERLVPLFVFPDEVVHLADYKKNPLEADKKRFISEVERKLGRKVTDAEISSSVLSKEDFLKQAQSEVRELLLDRSKLPRVGPVCGAASCKCLFQSLEALLK